MSDWTADERERTPTTVEQAIRGGSQPLKVFASILRLHRIVFALNSDQPIVTSEDLQEQHEWRSHRRYARPAMSIGQLLTDQAWQPADKRG